MTPEEYRYLLKLYTSGPIVRKATDDLLRLLDEQDDEIRRLRDELKKREAADSHDIARSA
jgi:hypothetical protein